MCTKARAYLTLLREYKAEIVMILLFQGLYDGRNVRFGLRL